MEKSRSLRKLYLKASNSKFFYPEDNRLSCPAPLSIWCSQEKGPLDRFPSRSQIAFQRVIPFTLPERNQCPRTWSCLSPFVNKLVFPIGFSCSWGFARVLPPSLWIQQVDVEEPCLNAFQVRSLLGFFIPPFRGIYCSGFCRVTELMEWTFFPPSPTVS